MNTDDAFDLLDILRRMGQSNESLRFAHEQLGLWQTIGGHPQGDKKHVGGTPVKIDPQGKIEAGPAALKGKKVDELKGEKKDPEKPAEAKPQKRPIKPGDTLYRIVSEPNTSVWSRQKPSYRLEVEKALDAPLRVAGYPPESLWVGTAPGIHHATASHGKNGEQAWHHLDDPNGPKFSPKHIENLRRTAAHLKGRDPQRAEMLGKAADELDSRLKGKPAQQKDPITAIGGH